MARLVFAMNQSLDGYVDYDRFAPGPGLFRHFIEQVGGVTGSFYGRKLYEIMRYWDEDRPEWGEPERAYAEAWRKMPKWVASRTLKEVGPNATLLGDDLEAEVKRLKSEQGGQIDVGGPVLAGELTDLGLIDAYRIYLHPVVLGSGAPFFTGPRPPLRLTETLDMGENVLRLTYVPA